MKTIATILGIWMMLLGPNSPKTIEKPVTLPPENGIFYKSVVFILETRPVPLYNLIPKPVTIVVAPDVDPSQDLKAREVKREVSDDVLDSILHVMQNSPDFQSDSIHWVVYPRTFFGDLIPIGKRLDWLKAKHPDDVIALVTRVEAKVEKDATNVDYDSDGKKIKTQRFFMTVKSRIDLHSAKGFIKSLNRDGTVTLDDRTVMSGLLSAGPSMSNNAQYAFQAAEELAKNFMQNFYPEPFYHTTYIDIKKEWQPMYDFYQYGELDKAINELNQYMTHKQSDGNMGRLYFLRSICWFKKGDYNNAITDAQDADRLWASDRSYLWRNFLMRYTVENEIIWK